MERSSSPFAQVSRIGLFFDGTGNNAANAPFADTQPANRSGSHATAPTNIFKLSQLYGGPGVKALYIPGIGTQDGQPDSLLASALGRGRLGVLARAEQGVAAVRQLTSHPVTVDLFGFSRGAAAARHCANLLLQVPGVSVGFIGLFDTVAAVAGPMNLQLHLAPARFANVVHLVARDEHRAHFPLAQVCAGHVEIEVPGAHSDVGGGYFALEREQLLVGRMQALTVGAGTAVEATSIYREAQRIKATWLSRGWPPGCLKILAPAPTPLLDRQQPAQQRVYAALQLQREVRGELSQVYLRVMHEWALARGVPLAPVAGALPVELEQVCQRFLRGHFSLSPEEEDRLRLQYIHLSAHWNPLAILHGNQPRAGATALYINAPAANGRRVRRRY